mmetsp:Transcript_54156/g.118619  ORF Transcript_54156/g.118619 Transcript_54156/m.118619 type:complete len:485 (+) Transcript_54156:63-1517(+)
MLTDKVRCTSEEIPRRPRRLQRGDAGPRSASLKAGKAGGARRGDALARGRRGRRGHSTASPCNRSHVLPELGHALLHRLHGLLGLSPNAAKFSLHLPLGAHAITLQSQDVLRPRHTDGLHNAADKLMRIEVPTVVVVEDAEEVLRLPQVNAELGEVSSDFLVVDLPQELLLGHDTIAVRVCILEDLVDLHTRLVVFFLLLLHEFPTLSAGLIQRVLHDDRDHDIHHGERRHGNVGDEEDGAPRLMFHSRPSNSAPGFRGRDLEEGEHALRHAAKELDHIAVILVRLPKRACGKDAADVDNQAHQQPRPDERVHGLDDAGYKYPERGEEAEQPEQSHHPGKSDDPDRVKHAELIGVPAHEAQDKGIHTGQGHKDEVEYMPTIQAEFTAISGCGIPQAELRQEDHREDDLEREPRHQEGLAPRRQLRLETDVNPIHEDCSSYRQVEGPAFHQRPSAPFAASCLAICRGQGRQERGMRGGARQRLSY